MVVCDGRAYACTGVSGPLRRYLQPGRGVRTTRRMAPSSFARRYMFASSRLLRVAREPIPSSTSDCIANTHSFLRYRIPPISRDMKEPCVKVITSSSAIRFPPLAPDAACTRCAGRVVPSAETDARLLLEDKARDACFCAACAVFFHLSILSFNLCAISSACSALLVTSLASCF